ncbi:hypothetical protein HHL16_13710 [Pseudoflavitalea sp. G-6-1-2]|uniref:hypothetical protein n=1 Tax=Pseudoflavitalea sp. G-6-1-2 TaxID=2728841 RepID=UPI00146D4811|nr:hypothetical protein [Pseudoflavitalea sp. G-6-1-2]NML21940.1 hypothetical protein [Pseudoflavitalea sp. G-6-1-2]
MGIVAQPKTQVYIPGTNEYDPTKELYEKFTVTSIDSAEKIYLIYVQKQSDSALYKIVSRKINTDCADVKVGKVYSFIVRSLTEPLTINNTIIDIRSNLHIGGFSWYGTTVLLEREKVKDVYEAHNLSGLCLTNKYHLKLLGTRPSSQ